MFISYTKSILKILRAQIYSLIPVRSTAKLVDTHFRLWSHPNHPNRSAFKAALQQLDGRPAVIVETGTSAWGTDSTRLWARYVQKFGGELWSVDLRKEPKLRLAGQLKGNVHLVVGDSVEFLQAAEFPKANLYFLDSWDVDWSDPMPSALHGLQEFREIQKYLSHGDIVIIDDTPKSDVFWPASNEDGAIKFENEFGVMPGKGALVLKEIEGNSMYDVIFHEYAIVIKIVCDFTPKGRES